MPVYRMGEALGVRDTQNKSVLSFVLDLIFGTTLPRFDPAQYGLADYSFYEGVVNFQLAKANGVKRPIIRVGQGYYGLDVQFKVSSANSKGVFPVRDFYWMLDAQQSANGQAITCANALKAYGQMDADSILFADFEIKGVDASFLWGFIFTLKAQIPGIKIGIYTGYSFWQTYGSVSTTYAFQQYPLWIAWPVNPYQTPKPLAPWGSNWTYHQWTFNGDGKFYGAGSLGLDLSYENPALLPPPPTPTPTPVPVANHIVTIKYKDGTSDEVQFQSNLSQSLDNASEVDVDSVPFPRVVPVPPPPVPTPVPTPSNLFDIKIRTVEWLEQPAPPDVGSFAIIGGRGIQEWIAIGPNEVKFIRSMIYPAMGVNNDLIWHWANGDNFTGEGKTLYYGYGADGVGFYRWGIGLMSSVLGHPRQYCAIENYDPTKPYQRVTGIPYQANGDYSAYTPEKHPEYWFFVPTIYPPKLPQFPNGYLGWGSHNGYIFLMPFFDARTFPKVSSDAAKFGGLIETTVFKGVHS